MKPIRIAAALVALMLSPFALAQSSVAADDITTLTLRSGHSMVLPAPGLSRVAVGDGRIAGVVAIGRTDVVVNGKTPGETTLFIWRGSHRYTYEVTVSEQSVDNIAAMLRSTILIPNVQVVSFDHSVILRGTVQTADEMSNLDSILTRFRPDAVANKYSLVNAVAVARPLGALQDDLAAVPGAAQTRVARDDKGDLIVSGRVADRATAERVLDRVRADGGATLGLEGRVVDRLGIDAISQVDVKVYILEIDRTGLDQLGIRLQSGTPDVNHPGFYTLGDPSFPFLENPFANGSTAPNSGPAVAGRGLNIGAFLRTTILAPTLDLIEQSGHGKLLSSPDLVTMPGTEATFLVGGEIPIPYASGPDQIAI